MPTPERWARLDPQTIDRLIESCRALGHPLLVPVTWLQRQKQAMQDLARLATTPAAMTPEEKARAQRTAEEVTAGHWPDHRR